MIDRLTFELLDAINREGLENVEWQMCKDIENTTFFFGTLESIRLEGMWLAIWRDKDDYMGYIDALEKKPDHTLQIDDGAYIQFFKL